jgi:hypothetical protein
MTVPPEQVVVAPAFDELAAAAALAGGEPLVDVVDMDPPVPRLLPLASAAASAARRDAFVSEPDFKPRRWSKQGALVNTLQGEFRADLWSPGAAPRGSWGHPRGGRAGAARGAVHAKRG